MGEKNFYLIQAQYEEDQKGKLDKASWITTARREIKTPNITISLTKAVCSISKEIPLLFARTFERGAW